jgi:hypothetical protein
MFRNCRTLGMAMGSKKGQPGWPLQARSKPV